MRKCRSKWKREFKYGRVRGFSFGGGGGGGGGGARRTRARLFVSLSTAIAEIRLTVSCLGCCVTSSNKHILMFSLVTKSKVL